MKAEGIAAGVLTAHGVRLDNVRCEVLYVLEQSACGPSSSASTAVRPVHYSEAARRALNQALLAARWYEHP